jgi:hypothetical protein
MACRRQDDLGVRAASDRRDRAFGRVEGVVGVRVDQSGQQRAAAAVDDRVIHPWRVPSPMGFDGRDPVVIDDDVHVVMRHVRHAVDQPDRLEDRAHRTMLPAGPGGRP